MTRRRRRGEETADDGRLVIYPREVDIDVGHLFDPDAYEAPSAQPAEDDFGAIADAVREERSLVPGPDGRPARVIHLHSLDKAYYVRFYADIVAKAMKQRWRDQIAWVELYSGPGTLWVKEQKTFMDGSPLEALGIKKPYGIYAFADLDPRCVEALDARIAEKHPDLRNDVHIFQGDANSPELHDQLVSVLPKNALIVLYADPAELNFHFETIKFFADRYEHLDLLLNFPAAGVVRALAAGHDAKAASVLGHAEPLALIGPTSARTNVSLSQFFEGKLRGLGYEHFASEPIKNSKNSAIYDLMIASRDPRAKDFFEKALARSRAGQYRMTGLF